MEDIIKGIETPIPGPEPSVRVDPNEERRTIPGLFKE